MEKNPPAEKTTPRTVRLISLGCAKNLVDSEVMLGILKEKGWTLSGQDEADVVIVNTCSFIRESQEEAIDTILSLAAAKEEGKCGRLVVAGCLPQRFGAELAAEMPEVDLFLGTGEVGRIAELLEKPAGRERQFIGPPTYLYDDRSPRILTSLPGSAYVKISEGCSNFCSYCVIPKIRGTMRSREVSSVVKEAKRLVAGGVREINLIGQDTTAYGRDRRDRADLVGLLTVLSKIDDLRWLRLLYAHPARVSAELIRVIRDNEKVCKYLDLPLQHIDDSILRAMNRPVAEAAVRNLLDRLRTEVPHIVLRTSLMVGFPGETEKSFRKLVDFVRETKFDHLGVFRFSKEEGTPAAAMKKQVSARVKDQRYHEIMRLQKEISRKKQKAHVGRQVSVLVERPGNAPGVLWEGRSRGQAPEVDGVTCLTKGKARPGEIVEVRITKATAYDLYGEVLSAEC